MMMNRPRLSRFRRMTNDVHSFMIFLFLPGRVVKILSICFFYTHKLFVVFLSDRGKFPSAIDPVNKKRNKQTKEGRNDKKDGRKEHKSSSSSTPYLLVGAEIVRPAEEAWPTLVHHRQRDNLPKYPNKKIQNILIIIWRERNQINLHWN